jgi:hypothetical protein
MPGKNNIDKTKVEMETSNMEQVRNEKIIPLQGIYFSCIKDWKGKNISKTLFAEKKN